MGDVKPWVMGEKTHVLLPCCLTTFVVLSPFLVSSNLFNVLLGSWVAMAVGGWAVIAFGSGGGRTVSPFPTSTLHP